ncbi:hypothetical protein Tco_0134667 [Tanacetum coccineum]
MFLLKREDSPTHWISSNVRTQSNTQVERVNVQGSQGCESHGYDGNQGYVRNSGNVTTVGNYTGTAGRNTGNTSNAGNQMGNVVIVKAP